jgi:hypothetical protein
VLAAVMRSPRCTLWRGCGVDLSVADLSRVLDIAGAAWPCCTQGGGAADHTWPTTRTERHHPLNDAETNSIGAGGGRARWPDPAHADPASEIATSGPSVSACSTLSGAGASPNSGVGVCSHHYEFDPGHGCHNRHARLPVALFLLSQVANGESGADRFESAGGGVSVTSGGGEPHRFASVDELFPALTAAARQLKRSVQEYIELCLDSTRCPAQFVTRNVLVTERALAALAQLKQAAAASSSLAPDPDRVLVATRVCRGAEGWLVVVDARGWAPLFPATCLRSPAAFLPDPFFFHPPPPSSSTLTRASEDASPSPPRPRAEISSSSSSAGFGVGATWVGATHNRECAGAWLARVACARREEEMLALQSYLTLPQRGVLDAGAGGVRVREDGWMARGERET